MKEPIPDFNKKPENFDELKNLVTEIPNNIDHMIEAYKNNSVGVFLVPAENFLNSAKKFIDSNAEMKINNYLSEVASNRTDLLEVDLKVFGVLISDIQNLSEFCQALVKNEHIKTNLLNIKEAKEDEPELDNFEDFIDFTEENNRDIKAIIDSLVLIKRNMYLVKKIMESPKDLKIHITFNQ